MNEAERVATVEFHKGFHARPKSDFVRIAREYECEVRVSYAGDREPPGNGVVRGVDGKREGGGREVDGKSIFGLAGLTHFVRRGEPLRIRARGPDAQKCVDALARYLEIEVSGKLYGRLEDLRHFVVRLLSIREMDSLEEDELRTRLAQAGDAVYWIARDLGVEDDMIWTRGERETA